MKSRRHYKQKQIHGKVLSESPILPLAADLSWNPFDLFSDLSLGTSSHYDAIS
jgi:hypothetical protein